MTALNQAVPAEAGVEQLKETWRSPRTVAPTMARITSYLATSTRVASIQRRDHRQRALRVACLSLVSSAYFFQAAPLSATWQSVRLIPNDAEKEAHRVKELIHGKPFEHLDISENISRLDGFSAGPVLRFAHGN
jgi:hypothetical protein